MTDHSVQCDILLRATSPWRDAGTPQATRRHDALRVFIEHAMSFVNGDLPLMRRKAMRAIRDATLAEKLNTELKSHALQGHVGTISICFEYDEKKAERAVALLRQYDYVAVVDRRKNGDYYVRVTLD